MRSFLTLPPLLTLATASPELFPRQQSSPPPTNPSFISTVLSTVNAYRSAHAARPLTWDANLAAFALQKANGCRLNHAGPYGENAYWTWYYPPTYTPDFNAEIGYAFEAWNSQEEIDAYLAGDLMGGSHFTQTVWKATERIGCAFSSGRCTGNPEQEWWFYCDFWPRGNLRGSYVGNVTV
ncbi:CAP domain-containing protein [Triangularia verruculosa]|uniref:CAP domain-containing protein n=1 Tax=Triangularia verruculosa TaxID=2587418 RepID=A0AAN6XI19_9PEZI|nr:CAP domain-containing protein [Triangularia verruculosa]